MIRYWMLLASLIMAQAAFGKPYRALYLTDFSNPYHDYKEQVEKFLPALQQEFNFVVDVVGRNQGDLLRTLANPGFSASYDLLIYNACLADSRDYRLAYNLMRETAAGKATILLHCAMHNFRGTSSHLGIIGRKKLAADQKSWREEYPEDAFPVWWQYTGVDTTTHKLYGKLASKKLAEHPILAGFPDHWQSAGDELYLIKTRSEQIYPLISSQDGKHIVAWLHRYGQGKIFATSLGHDSKTLLDQAFLGLMARGMAYLLGELNDQGVISPGARGNQSAYNYSKSIQCLPEQIVTPKTEAELQSEILKAVEEKRSIKVISIDKPNSYSDVICSRVGGLLINLKHFNQVLSFDPEQRLVTVQPGVTIDELNRTLKDAGLVLPTTADYSGITVAGGMGTGAHHSSLRIEAGIHDYVERMRLVDGLGRLQQIEGERARHLAVHLGYLGAITSITLRVEPLTKLRYGYEIASDADLEQQVIEKISSHDYARISWFAGVGRYVLEYYDRVPLETEGRSYHNLWRSSAGPIRLVGSLPYDAINRLPEPVQCTAANVRSTLWSSPIQAVDSDSKRPVGFAGDMLGSTCAKGECPWDFGAISRTMELAIAVTDLSDWMQDVRDILSVNRACFPVLGIYMRFARASDAWLASSNGQDTMMFEIHIPKDSSGFRYERGSAAYDEIQQMTRLKYNGRAHWAKNSKAIFVKALGLYENAGDFIAEKNQLDPQGLFENEFWDIIQAGTLPPAYTACTLERSCICERDLDCAAGYSCQSGRSFTDANICVKD